jgi:membrane fusion protein, multidrug efflux system
LKDAIVIPQRATFEILAKKYAFVVTASEKKHDAEVTDEHNGEHKVEHAGSGQTTGLSPVTSQSDAQNAPKHQGVHPEDRVGEPSAIAHNMEFGIVHQREITILSERDDIFLIKDGLGVNDKIILEGIRQVRDGEEVEYEFLASEQALDQLKYHAE